MRRQLLSCVLTALVTAAAVSIAYERRPSAPVPPHTLPVPVPERITISRPEPHAPSGRAFHTLRVVGGTPAALTDEWVVTVLTDRTDEGGGVTAASYTAKAHR